MSTNNKYQQAKERMDALFNFLVEEKGYVQYPYELNNSDLKTGFEKRFASRYSIDTFQSCECNEWDLAWHVEPYLASFFPDSVLCSATIKIFGETSGKWVEFQFYGLSPEELMNDIDMLEEKLFNAWRALG